MKHTLPLIAALLTTPLAASAADLPDLALQPAQVITDIGPDHAKGSRGVQGVPAIERAANGRLWAASYAEKSKRGVEGTSSYVVLATNHSQGQADSALITADPADRSSGGPLEDPKGFEGGKVMAREAALPGSTRFTGPAPFLGVIVSPRWGNRGWSGVWPPSESANRRSAP